MASKPTTKPKESKENEKFNSFRAIIRKVAADLSKSIAAYLQDLLGDVAIRENGEICITAEIFKNELIKVKEIKSAFSISDLDEIFGECDEGASRKVSIPDLADVCTRTISKARALAMKLRLAIMKIANGEAQYRREFSSLVISNAKFADPDQFGDYAEDLLEKSLSDADVMGIISLFDMDGDGKVSCEDFVGFILGRTADAMTVLKGGDPEMIVDLKISTSGAQEAELSRSGYQQLISPQGTVHFGAAGGTFGRGESLWYWRRKQGTCSGRLKPIVDIQLCNTAHNSNMVLSGYTRVMGYLGGQSLWIKRATEEEEANAILDLHVTLGKSKVPSDPIWTSPGVGWIRVDGNFTRVGLVDLGRIDSFVWFLPAKPRTMDEHMHNPIRSAVGLSDEIRKERALKHIRTAIRHYVPISDIARLAKQYVSVESSAVGAGSKITDTTSHAMHYVDYTALYHLFDHSGKSRLSKSKFGHLLNEVGACVEPEDLNWCFYYFNVHLDSYITLREFGDSVALCDHEIDLALDNIRRRLLKKASSIEPKGKDGTEKSVAATSSNKLRDHRQLGQVFTMINSSGSGILSLEELLSFTAQIELYITEHEGRKMLSLIDVGGDERVTESEFIEFMKMSSDVLTKKAQRLRTSAGKVRTWLQRSQSGAGTLAHSSLQHEWNGLKVRREKAAGIRFPGYLTSEDLLLLLVEMGERLSAEESRELTLMIGPDKAGKLTIPDLQAFMVRSCRMFGEIEAVLARDVLKPLIDAYAQHRNVFRTTGTSNPELENRFKTIFEDIERQVRGAYVAHQSTETPAVAGAGSSSSGPVNKATGHEVVSIVQLKVGIETATRIGERDATRTKASELQLLNVEEWAIYSCRLGAAIAVENRYGVNVRLFLNRALEQIVGRLDDHGDREIVSLDTLKRDLQRMIIDEAKSAGKGKVPDFVAAFNLFDSDGNGSINVDEFRRTLFRLKLVDNLPEAQIPQLVESFDTAKKGYINLDDFLKFVHANKQLVEEDEDHVSDDDDELPGLAAVSPPTAVTRNADCDWFCWHLWKESCRVEPEDPEGVVTELESACTEANITSSKGTVSAKELWNILFEMKLRGGISREQFEKGIAYVTDEPDPSLAKKKISKASEGKDSAADSNEVNYEALCRYIVRMGRAYNSMVQEKRNQDQKAFEVLFVAIRKEFEAILAEQIPSGPASASKRGGSKAEMSRLEKVLRRLDEDGDNLLTIKEFRQGLKRLRVKDAKKWNAEMCRRFFMKIDEKKPQSLSIVDLICFVRDKLWEGKDKSSKESGKSVKGSKHGGDLSDEDEGNEVFARKHAITDSALMKKVTDTLLDTAVESGSAHGIHGLDAVKSAIRKFFHRSDPEGRGTVSEERFRAFIRRSGLQDRLTTGELRQLIEKLRRVRGASSDKAQVIDYERLCRLLTQEHHPESVPHSKAEAILTRLQDACFASAANGKHFLSLCALVDQKGSGLISVDDLLFVVKMVGCPLARTDIELMCDLLAENTIQLDKDRVDYNELNYVIEYFVPRDVNLFGNPDLADSRSQPMRSTGALAAYATAGMPTVINGGRAMNRSLSTPGGGIIYSPYKPKPPPLSLSGSLRFPNAEFEAQNNGQVRRTFGTNGLPRDHFHDTAAFNRILSLVSDRIQQSIQERSRAIGAPVNLKRLFEMFDPTYTGYIPVRSLQGSLDDIGITLSSSDLLAISNLFGRPDDDKIDYESFCNEVLDPNTAYRRLPVGNISGDYNRGGNTGGISEISKNSRVIQRVRELHANGVNILGEFAIHDPQNMGQIDSRRFREVVLRLQLLQTGFQLQKAMEEFESLSDRSLVHYEDFCSALEEAVTRDSINRGYDGNTFGSSSRRPRDNDRGGRASQDRVPRDRDPPIRPRWAADAESEHWAGQSSIESSPRGSANNDTFARFRSTLAGFRDAPGNGVDLDDGSESGLADSFSRALSPPKVTDSTSFRQAYSRPGSGQLIGSRAAAAPAPHSPHRGLNSQFESPSTSLRASHQITPIAPRASPSRVGSLIWGSHTPLAQKGNAPYIDEATWCCTVCLYAENPVSAAQCTVCDSPNYTIRTDYQLKEQCRSCHFQNGHLATQCEMCGKPLSKAANNPSKPPAAAYRR